MVYTLHSHTHTERERERERACEIEKMREKEVSNVKLNSG